MPGTDSDPLTPPEVREKRVAPPGVLPKNTQAWVLSGLAAVMVLVIAFSGHNQPKEKAATAIAPAPATSPNAAQIQEYETRLKEEAQRLQMAKEQLNRTQAALGLAPGASARSQAASYAPSGESRLAAAQPRTETSSVQIDRDRREERSLFASNIALSYRKEALPAQAPAPLAPVDLVAKALSGYAPSAPEPAGTTAPATQSIPSTSASPVNDDPEARSAKARAAELDQAQGKEYRLFEGTVLETALTNRLDGTFSGPVNCLVTTNVYSHNGEHVLVPQGSRVLGEARKVETFGDRRLAVAFHRLIMPDGYSVSLDKFQGLSQIGETGLQDQVNHHNLQVFGVSIALGLVAGFSQANTGYGLDESATDAYRQGMASSLSQSSMHILDRYLNVVPTITIREGHRVKVYLSDDLLLPAYEKHQMPGDL